MFIKGSTIAGGFIPDAESQLILCLSFSQYL